MLEKHFIHNKEVDSVLLSGKYEKQNIMFSIVIPTYKRPTLLEYTLTSAIRQNIIENYEIIVVDNEPYEDKINDTQKVIRKFSCDKLLYFRNKENIGLCGNWNRCIELARGHYVTILHDDDWLDPDYLSVAYNQISGKKAILFKPRIWDFRNYKTGSKIKFDSFKSQVRLLFDHVFPKTNLDLKDLYLRNPSYGTLGIMFETNAIKNLGGFQEDLYPILDYDLLVKYVRRYGAKLIKKRVTNYRIDVNESHNCAKSTPQMLFEYREQMFHLYESELKGVNRWRKELYINDIGTNEKTWNIVIDKPSYYQNIRHSFHYKLFKIKYYLYMLFRV